MNHENSIFRFFGVDRISGGTVRKWAPMACDCVGMVVHMVDVSTVDSFNRCLQALADCLDLIRPNLAILVFAFGSPPNLAPSITMARSFLSFLMHSVTNISLHSLFSSLTQA